MTIVDIDTTLSVDGAYTLIDEHLAAIAQLRRHIDRKIEQREAGAIGAVLATAGLSDAERRVALHIRSRLTNPEMARVLNLSVDTVKTHLKRIYAKLGVSSRTEAVAVLNGARPVAGGAR